MGVPELSAAELPNDRTLVFPQGVCYSDGKGQTQIVRDAPQGRPMLLATRFIKSVSAIDGEPK